MKKALGVALTVTVMSAPAAAQWRTHEFRDTFDRRTPAIRVDADAQIFNRGRLERERAALFLLQNRAYVVTGDVFICHSPPRNPVRVSIQVDGGRIHDMNGAGVSDARTAIFLDQAAQNLILAAQREIKMETRDHCGTTVAITFVATSLNEVLNHIDRRPPPPAQQQQQSVARPAPPRSAQQEPQASRPETPVQPEQAAAIGAVAAARIIADGMKALGGRDFVGAEAAAREVIASREASQQVNAQILLADALMGRRQFSNAALAYDAARKRNPTGSRAPEANVGLANAFIALNSNREACEVLNALRSARPDLAGAVAERAADARRRAQCR